MEASCTVAAELGTDLMKCVHQWGRVVMACPWVIDCILGHSAGELFCKVGTLSHILGRLCPHSRQTPFCCSPSPLTASEAALVVGRRLAVSLQRGFTDLLRQRTPESTGRMGRDCQPLLLSDFLLTPILHFLSRLASLSLSPHGTSLGLCPSVESKMCPVLF